MSNTVDILFRYLPIRISRAIHLLPHDIFENINEIRLRKSAPTSITVGNKNLFFNENGELCGLNSAIEIFDCELAECISKLTGGSLYTCDEFLTNGFIPLPEGGRAGVCGRANFRSGKNCGFTEILSVNLRLHRNVPNFAMPLINDFSLMGVCGTLVCSPPALGKTTFLRSCAYLLATGRGIAPKRVGIADERCELSVGLENQGLADILTSLPKAEAITMLTRTMAPEIIICDEISASETDAVLEAQNTGVALIASAHCRSPRELLFRGRLKELLKSGIFQKCVILGYEKGYNIKICETEEFL